MPKSQFIDPEKVREIGKITFRDIPINLYNKSIHQEKASFTREDFIRIYRDMSIIRELESMLTFLNTAGEYEDLKLDLTKLQMHLSTGQEAYAVGQAYLLGRDDQIFGSHRSHGEVVAKGLSVIEKTGGEELFEIMSSFDGGSILKIVEGKQKEKGNIKELALDFFLFGVLSEILTLRTGFNKGMSGPLHVFFPPFGIYPNNSIVGGSAGIATGAALFKKINSRKGIVISNTGDGSVGCGPVWEAFCMATMDQYRMLWEGSYSGGLPLMFNFVNNHYSIGSQSCGETMGYGILARIGAGVNPEQMHAERVDGFDPLAVIDVMRRKIKILEDKKGPVLLDTITYRFTGHTSADASSYRTREEINAWKEHDSLNLYKEALIKAKIASPAEFDEIVDANRALLKKILSLAVNEGNPSKAESSRDVVNPASILFSNLRVEKMGDGACQTIIPKENNPRLMQFSGKSRAASIDNRPVSSSRVYQFRDAIFEALLDKFYTDPTMLAYGQENRDWGGIFGVYRGLEISLPYHRLFNTPVSDAAIVSSAVGYAICGGRVVVELMCCDLLGRAADEVFNQLARWQAMSGGLLRMPVVLRIPVVNRADAQLSFDWTSIIAHMPGLKVVCPATPYDARGLMNSALMGTDPVIFIENENLYDVGEMFHQGGVPEEYYEIPIGEPDIKRDGSDLTMITLGSALYKVMEAADMLANSYGVSSDVIDMRSVVPFDYTKIIDSVRKTGRVILIGEFSERGSILNDVAQLITETLFRDLKAPPVVIGAASSIAPHYGQGNTGLETMQIIDAVHGRLILLKGHRAENVFSPVKKIARRKIGL